MAVTQFVKSFSELLLGCAKGFPPIKRLIQNLFSALPESFFDDFVSVLLPVCQ